MLSATDTKLVPFIESGDVKLVDKSINIEVTRDGKAETKTFPYQGLEAVTPKGAAAIMDGAINTKDDDGNIIRQSVIGAFNYALDLFQRANERSKALGKMEDPSKAIDRAVAAMVKAGVPEALAREMVLKGRAAQEAAAPTA
jgi:hypothetical protein